MKSNKMMIYLLSVLAAIGGFLFGYDTGVVSGAMEVIVDEENGLLSGLDSDLQDFWHELIVGSTVGAAAVVALTTSAFNEKFGRKVTILVSSVIFVIGSVVMAIANSKEILLVGRIVVGIAIGLASMSVPVYISEAAPPELRGVLTVSYNTMVVFGQLVATIICGLFAEVKEGWRYMLGLAAVPALIQLIGFVFMPRSPRWLIGKGRVEDARQVLTRIREQGKVQQELDEIQEAVKEASQLFGFWTSMKNCFTSGPTRRALLIGCGLQVFQQLSGINTLMYYAATIVRMAGIGSASNAIWISAGIGSLYFLACFIGIFCIEKLGRRKLILFSLGGVLISLVIIGVGFQLADGNTPTGISQEGLGSCGYYTSCKTCLENDCSFCESGNKRNFCFDETLNITLGTCPVKDSAQIYDDYCPTKTGYSWTIITGLALYLIFFAAGMAPVPWTINSEIYPIWARSFATSMSTGTNWTFNLIISISFLSLTTALTRAGAFYVYAGIAAIGWILFFLVLPETRGVSLEQMETLFSGPVLVFRK